MDCTLPSAKASVNQNAYSTADASRSMNNTNASNLVLPSPLAGCGRHRLVCSSTRRVVSKCRDILLGSPTLGCPPLPRRNLSLHYPSIFSFHHTLLFSLLSLSISLYSFSVRVPWLLSIAVCSPLPSFSGVSSFRPLLLIPPPSFCLRIHYISSEPGCSPLHLASPSVSLPGVTTSAIPRPIPRRNLNIPQVDNLQNNYG